MKKHVIVVAGGSGTRMGQTIPKQFLKIAGSPIIVHTIEAFLRFDNDINLVLVLPESHLDIWDKIKSQYFQSLDIKIALGGNSRFQSVKSGLSKVDEGLVAIHDAVRPFITPDIIGRAFLTAANTGSAVTMVALKDSIRRKNKQNTKSLNREDFLLVQTPQVFDVQKIKTAYVQEEHPSYTDDASVYESIGNLVSAVDGDYNNIKITTPEDLIFAEALLAERHKKSLK